MAAKIKGCLECDCKGRDCIVLRKSKGKINQREAFEWLEENGYKGQSFVHMVDCPEEPSEDLYEEGDTWVLYMPYDILEEVKLLSDG